MARANRSTRTVNLVLADVGLHFPIFLSCTPTDNWEALGAYIREKLLALPKPLAVFAYCDYDAAKVEIAALEAGLRVPEDVAILGVDNDPLVCDNGEVSLSSICHDRTRIGYEGAALLEKLMSRQCIPTRTLTILPTRIEERASTRGIYSDDPIARSVIAFFSEHLGERTGLPEAAAAVRMSPRALERHFASSVGRSVTSYLRELRLIRAHRLVKETVRPLGEIARECGFSNAQHFSNAFRDAYGQTPSTTRAGRVPQIASAIPSRHVAR